MRITVLLTAACALLLLAGPLSSARADGAAVAPRVTAADVLDQVQDIPGLKILNIELDISQEQASDSFQAPRTVERVITNLDPRITNMQCVKGRKDGKNYSVEIGRFYQNRCFYYKLGRRELEGLFNQRVRAVEALYGKAQRERPAWVPAELLFTDVSQPGDTVAHYYWTTPQRFEVLYLAYNETRGISAHILVNAKAHERAFAEARERLDDHNRYLQGKDKVHR
jgi:hypothetical protein